MATQFAPADREMESARGATRQPVSEERGWQVLRWRGASGEYAFELSADGRSAILSGPCGAALALPLEDWRTAVERIGPRVISRRRHGIAAPPRSHARWSEEELAALAAGYRTGQSVAALALEHNRSTYAVEAQLVRAGLIRYRDRLYAPRNDWDRWEGQSKGEPREHEP
jgi:hypothetical protein